MKAKLFMFLMAVSLCLILPTLTYAQGYTDEEIEMEGSDIGNNEDDFGPVSYIPELLKAVVSHQNQTITLDFLEDLGTVTIWITDEAGQLYLSQEIDTTKDKKVTIDIKALPEQKYNIICFNVIENQKGKFELHK